MEAKREKWEKRKEERRGEEKREKKREKKRENRREKRREKKSRKGRGGEMRNDDRSLRTSKVYSIFETW